MLTILRVILVVVLAIFMSVAGLLYSLVRFRNPNNVRVVSKWISKLHVFLGLKVECRYLDNAYDIGPCIYIANHQNNYDLVTMGAMVMPRTVTVGKKSLIWIPFFGLLYWLTGNVLLDRDNKSKAHETMDDLANRIKDDNLSIWMFPEGTRSRGRGLMPFKLGAFHLAIQAGVPIVPICCSEQHEKVDLNRRDNGWVICEMLEPIDTTGMSRSDVRRIAKDIRKQMTEKIEDLNQQVAEREAQEKQQA